MIRFGGDYNPEQWPREVWDEDIALMKEAGVNLVTLGVFSWALLEPREGEFDFEWLDDIVNRLHLAGIDIDMATATASPPPWFAVGYPDSLPVDEYGLTYWPGSRQHYSPSSLDYRRLASRLAGKMAERYGSHPAVVMWHINNEYGCHVAHCYSDGSARAFRRWLAARYGTIDALNDAWGTAFWSQRYTDFEQILPPRKAPTWRNPGQQLDFARFSSDELLACYRAEREAIRPYIGDAPVTTNFMGFFKPVDYWSWAAEVDVISDDAYPDPHDPRSPVLAAMTRDLMRSLKDGQPWMLMEQSTSAVNWRPVNARKRPGQMRALSMQAVVRGADACMYFQWRQSSGGAERFHSGMIPHAGTNTRIWREVSALGRELRDDWSSVVGQRSEARVAIVLDWSSWWSVEQSANPSTLSYLETLTSWYEAFHALGVAVDFIPVGPVSEKYAVVVAPMVFCATDEALEALGDVAKRGDTLVVSYLTGATTETGRVRLGGYLGPLADVMGVNVEEFVPMPSAPDQAVASHAHVAGPGISAARVSQWAEELRVEGADVVAHFIDGELDGAPAITCAKVGAGSAWYVSTGLSAPTIALLARTRWGVEPHIRDREPASAVVEFASRGDRALLISHSDMPATVTYRVDASDKWREATLAPFEVLDVAAAADEASSGVVREPASVEK
ncbi:MAG: beta-galactosidase [Microcella sp.]